MHYCSMATIMESSGDVKNMMMLKKDCISVYVPNVSHCVTPDDGQMYRYQVPNFDREKADSCVDWLIMRKEKMLLASTKHSSHFTNSASRIV